MHVLDKLIGLLIGVSAISAGELHTFTDNQGRSMKAEVLSFEGERPKLKREDGTVFVLSPDSLSSEDRAWLQKLQNDMPLSPDSIAIAMSRAKFDQSSETIDVKLTTGVTVKGGRTITREKWGYSIMINNRTASPLTTLRAEYLLFATVDNIHKEEKAGTLKKKLYRKPIEAIGAYQRLDFRTETITAEKSKYNGNIVSANTGARSSSEKLEGVWIRIYDRDTLLYENAMPAGLMKDQTWGGAE